MSHTPSSPTEPTAPPGFQSLTLDASQALRGLDDFDALLASKVDLDEKADILSFFGMHPQLSLVLGFYNSDMVRYDCMAHELPLLGLFRPDVVVGDWHRKRYCFVEFEDAKANSIFRHVGRRTSHWAPRFQQGYCQVVDWFWLIESQQNTPQFETQFGKRSIQAAGLLVIGRDSAIVGHSERHRFEWWRDHVIVDSRGITCRTYDELARDLRDRLSIARASWREAVARPCVRLRRPSR